jgi:copper(I)-binding protein
MICLLGALALGNAAPLSAHDYAKGDLQIDHPWTRATPPAAKVAAGYMTIRNGSSSPDRLVGATSPVCARVETHVTLKEGGVMKMREVKGYAIPAGGSFELKPGGAHLMFMDVKRPFKEGEKIPVTLRFERAGEVNVEFQVERLGAVPGHGH